MDGRGVSILLIKNPAGANEVLRTLTLEDGAPRPLARPERPHRRRPRRLLDLGRGLRGPGRPRSARDLRGNPRRGDGAAPEVRGDRRRDRGRAGAGAFARCSRRGRPRASASTRCRPTPRCSSCATCWLAAASRGGGRSEAIRAHPAEPGACGQARGRDLARRGVRRVRRRPAALARARQPGRRADPGPGRRHRPGDARPRRRGPRRDRARRRPRPARGAGRPRAVARPATSDASPPTLAPSTRSAASRSCSRPCSSCRSWEASRAEPRC